MPWTRTTRKAAPMKDDADKFEEARRYLTDAAEKLTKVYKLLHAEDSETQEAPRAIEGLPDKPYARKSELNKQYGFSNSLLMRAYRTYGQRFARKQNPTAPNSPIVFEIQGFREWLRKDRRYADQKREEHMVKRRMK